MLKYYTTAPLSNANLSLFGRVKQAGKSVSGFFLLTLSLPAVKTQ
jgi:hypothetical protein